jgi:hypothetical protein
MATAELDYRAAMALATQHGIESRDAWLVVKRLNLTNEDAMYIAAHPEHVGYWDDASVADRHCGHTGWVVWIGPHLFAIAQSNGDPWGIDDTSSLEHAISLAA